MSEKKNKTKVGEVAIYDARQLGVPRMLVLGVQHTFAMFGATVLVPILTGLNVSTTLLMARCRHSSAPRLPFWAAILR